MKDPDVEFDPDRPEPAPLAFVRAYWLRQRGAQTMPRRRDISPSDMRAYLRHVLLADVIDGGKDFRYRVVGTELQRYFKGNPTGKLMSEALAAFGIDTVRRTIETYASALARRTPLRIRGAGALYGQSAKLFDAVLAPLSDDGETPNMILGTFEFVWDFATLNKATLLVEPDEAALARALTSDK